MPAAYPSLLHQLLLDPKLNKLRYRAALGLFFVIVLLGSIPGARKEIGHVASGIVLHTLAYGFISLLLFTGSAGSQAARAGKTILTVALMGALDETVQSFLPYRSAAIADFLIDCNAAVIACALLWAFLPKPAEAR
jgi:VanZ family protein